LDAYVTVSQLVDLTNRTRRVHRTIQCARRLADTKAEPSTRGTKPAPQPPGCDKLGLGLATGWATGDANELVPRPQLPAVVLPAGRARDGLRVGLQVIGPYLEDRTVIDVAGRIADLIGGFVSPDPNDAPNSANLN
jgi:Asp-tRNA(Asn)/Glu-tRNA(Gln) amidotransferase A subunit family amidase